MTHRRRGAHAPRFTAAFARSMFPRAMHPALTYTLLGLCAAALVLGFWIEGRKEGSRWFRARRFAWILQVGAIVAAYFVLRPGRGADAPRDEIAAARAAGAPIFVDFYSNF